MRVQFKIVDNVVALPIGANGVPSVVQIFLVARGQQPSLRSKYFQRRQTPFHLVLQNIEVTLEETTASQQRHAHASVTLDGFGHLIKLFNQGEGVLALAICGTEGLKVGKSDACVWCFHGVRLFNHGAKMYLPESARLQIRDLIALNRLFYAMRVPPSSENAKRVGTNIVAATGAFAGFTCL